MEYYKLNQNCYKIINAPRQYYEWAIGDDEYNVSEVMLKFLQYDRNEIEEMLPPLENTTYNNEYKQYLENGEISRTLKLYATKNAVNLNDPLQVRFMMNYIM